MYFIFGIIVDIDPKFLFGTIPNPAYDLEVKAYDLEVKAYDLEVKVTDLKFMLKFCVKDFKMSSFLNPCMELKLTAKIFYLLARLNNVHRELLYYSRWRWRPANVKVFKTSLFSNLITDFIHLWYDETYWSKILCSTIPTTPGHVKVKVTDSEFSC